MLAAADLLVSAAAAFAFAAAVTASGGTGADLDGADCNLTVGVEIVKPGGGGFTWAGTPSRVAVGGAAFGLAGNIEGSSLSGSWYSSCLAAVLTSSCVKWRPN